MAFVLIPFFVITVAVFVSLFTAVVKETKKRQGVMSSDGHRVSAGEDLTCDTQHGHSHAGTGDSSEFGPRYIVHNDPEEGYVILNGVMRKLTDCRDL